MVVLDGIDEFQRRHRSLAFAHAVMKRYAEDRAGWLAASISYYGFISLLPALLGFVTVLYAIFGDRPKLLSSLLSALWASLPFVGKTTSDQVEPISGSVPTVIISLSIALWGALRAARAIQDGVNLVWCVPVYRRPTFFLKLAKAAVVLGLILAALGVIGAFTVTAFQAGLPAIGLLLALLVNLAIECGLVLLLFHMVIARKLTLAEVWPGMLVAAVGATALTLLGGLYVDRVVARASAIYGSFASVIGLLAWVSLLVTLFMFANVLNVVRVEHLWPRTLTGRHLGSGDFRANDLTSRRAALMADDRLAS